MAIDFYVSTERDEVQPIIFENKIWEKGNISQDYLR
jgi:hypothetical protein